jgi:para-aminobenzoate synthetase component II
MILLVDNYDSFVYNLARYVGELGYERCVKRNDAITLADIMSMQPSHIIISPGPCAPDQAGISLAVIQQFSATIPILGVCLGHQAIGQVYGAQVVRAKTPMHGKMSLITHDGNNIFAGLDNPLPVGRYHSLIVDEEKLSQDIVITARSEDQEVMAICHKAYPLFGVQFHPESVLTQQGHQLIANFLRYTTN